MGFSFIVLDAFRHHSLAEGMKLVCTATRTWCEGNVELIYVTIQRGGQGNIHKDKYAGHSTLAEERRASGAAVGGVGEKIKHLFGAGKE